MRPTGSPYRHAHPRALAPAPRRIWPTWWLDLVGAAVTLCRDVAGIAYVLRWRDDAHRRFLESCVGALACRMVDPAGLRRALAEARRVFPARGDDRQVSTVRMPAAEVEALAGLTKAPPKVATGEVEVPARLDVGAMVDDASAKWGPLTDRVADAAPPPIWTRLSPEGYRRMAEEMAKHLDDETRAARKGE